MDILDALEIEQEPTIVDSNYMHPGIFDAELYKLGVDANCRRDCLAWYDTSAWEWLLKYFEGKNGNN